MAAAGDDGRKWWTVIAVSLVFLPLVIDFYGIVVALPAIGRDLHSSTTSLAWTINAFMLGMAGFPLTGGMFGKLFVFSAAYDAGDWWLVLIGVVATAVSLGYYLNVVRWLYMRPATELRLAVAGGSPPRDSALGVAITAAVAVTVGSFFVVQPILDAASDAVGSLPF